MMCFPWSSVDLSIHRMPHTTLLPVSPYSQSPFTHEAAAPSVPIVVPALG